MKQKLFELLDSKKAFVALFLLNVLAALAVLSVSSALRFNDEKTYWTMGESILHGKFSSWYFLPDYYPETLRTPGYPVFLALCQLVSGSAMFVKVLQLLIYFVSVFLCTRIIRKMTQAYFYRTVFLLLLILNPQIVYYSGLISAEVLNIFFIVLVLYFVMRERTFRNALLIALFSYCAFIVRPAFLLFPFLLFFYFIFAGRKNFKYASLFILTYTILLLPFGIWNKREHGIFKVTSLEGGAGVAHIGFWLFKLPEGYNKQFYWPIAVKHDAIQPDFFSDKEKQENALLYEKECKDIFNALETYNSRKDSAYYSLMKDNDLGLLPLHNSKYTVAREKALWAITIQHIIDEPFFYLKSRLYTLFRSYVTGINRFEFVNAKSFLTKLKVVLPFIITFLFIFLGLLFITVRILRGKVDFPNKYAFLLLFWYYGLVHLPFTIQGRYTVPVHLLILMTLSISMMKKHEASIQSMQQ
ncbi:MAG TPA: hypothetical protein VI757_02505 [Bacteroidia bacterium]|nr:hypothetical protein [Bacteroidia bacterium]